MWNCSVNRLFNLFHNYHIVLLAGVIFASLYALSQVNYLLFHSLAEMFSVLMAGSIFVLAWNTRNFLKNGYLEVLGIGMLFVALIDLLHTLAFKGMGVFPESSANLPTQLWLAARYLHSGLLLVAPMFVLHGRVPRIRVLLAYSIVTSLLLGLIYWQVFPVALVETPTGVALTPFKIASEYAIILTFAIGMVLLWRKRTAFDPQVLKLLLFSAGFHAASDFLFTGYIQVTDLWNLTGHFLKLISFYLIYKAIVETGFVRPYNLLFRDLNQSEQNLRASELRERARAAQLEAVMDAVPALVWIANDPDCRVVTGNRTSYEFLRLPDNRKQSKTVEPDAIPTNFTIYQNGRELAPHELPLQVSAASGQPVRDFEETVVFDTGEIRQLYGNATPLFNPLGQPDGAVSVFIDITERARAEQALQESERRYRNLFETMTEGFALHEIMYDEQHQPVDYRLLEVNPAFEQMTGLTRADLVGKRLRELRPDVDLSWVERYARVARTGESLRFEDYSVLLGKHVEVLVYWLGENRVASLSIDVTQRRHDQQALLNSEARLRRLVDSNIIGIIYADASGRVTLANDAFLQIIGFNREDMDAGLINWVSMTPPDQLSLDELGINEAMQRGACTPYEKEYIRKDGSRVSVLIGYAYFKEDAPPYICFILDLTARKQAEAALGSYAQQLERSNRELQDFAFVASHDLQEPLRKIQAFGDRLKSSLEDRLAEDERDYLERMMNSANRMRNMVNDLLALSRVTTRAQPFEPVMLNDVIVEVLSDLEVRIERSCGRVEVGDLPQVYGDPMQLHQLLQNLVGNALKFHKLDQPPTVKVTSQLVEDGKCLQISVRDDGIGFDEQYVDRIFQPFQRLYGMGQYEGSGIGLAICRKIVEHHSGQITAHSVPGQGADFIVTLPMVFIP